MSNLQTGRPVDICDIIHSNHIYFIFCVFIVFSGIYHSQGDEAKLFSFLFINSLRIVIMQSNWGRIKPSSPWLALVDKISMKETAL